MTCVPIDVGGEGGEETATLMVNGTFNEIVGKTAIGAYIMVTISSLILAYFGSPWIFENIIYKKVSTDVGLTGATILVLIVVVSLGLGLAIDGGLKPSPKYDQFWVGLGILLFTFLSILTVALDRATKATNESSRLKINYTDFVAKSENVLSCIKKIIHPGDSSDKTMANALIFFAILDSIIISLAAIIIALTTKTKADKKAMPRKESYKMRKDMIIISFSVIYGSLAILWGIYIYSYRP